MNMKRLFRWAIPDSLVLQMRETICEKYEFVNKNSYSQEGEDLVLSRYFGALKNGFFIDVGAHHPKRFSNTYMFYIKGWRGVNIDANQGAIELFDVVRPEDTNIFQPIGNTREQLSYYSFNEPALNTFDKKVATDIHNDENNKYQITETIELMTKELTDVLAPIPMPSKISFLSIDVEGLDFQVLKSIDLDIYRPELILIESLGKNIEMDNKSDVTNYLKNHQYAFYYRTCNTCFYRDEKSGIE